MALTPKEIEDTLRLKEEMEKNLQRMQPLKKEMEKNLLRMRPLFERQFPVAAETLRLQEQWRQVAPTRSLVEELGRGHEEMKRLVGTNTFAEGLRNLTTEAAAGRGFAKISTLAEEITLAAARMAPAFGMIASVLQEAQKSTSFVTTLADALAKSPVMRLADSYRDLFAGFQQFAMSPQFEALVREARYSESFVERVLANSLVLDADVEMDVNAPLTAITTTFAERIATLPRGVISREGMITLLLSIIVSWYLGVLSERAITGHFDAKLANATRIIIEQIQERLAPPATAIENLAVVLRPLNVRVAPDLSAERTDVLHAGHQVNIVGRAEKWLEIEYFDFESASVKRGWIAERWTKEVSKE